MADDNKGSIVLAMVSCDLYKLNISVGKMPPNDSMDIDVKVDFMVDINDDSGEDGLYTVIFQLDMKTQDHYFYDIEAEARAAFALPNEMGRDEAQDYLNLIGAKLISAKVRTLIDVATSAFPFGPANIPDMNIGATE